MQTRPSRPADDAPPLTQAPHPARLPARPPARTTAEQAARSPLLRALVATYLLPPPLQAAVHRDARD